ncbi:MAG: hypothetical protein A2Y10_18565 [Planctomycetes bacterium GWF2_41_51]|nr:MAG: hypothetical protein A2Y10_18565 [Planctomycetes bacterium GWF2_41_51]HBG27149.1 hypothetical protein [Phycisphaerales bacterium]
MASLASALMIVGAIIIVDIKTTTLQDAANILTSLLGGGILAIYMVGFFTKLGDWRAVLIDLAFT